MLETPDLKKLIVYLDNAGSAKLKGDNLGLIDGGKE